MKVTKLTISFIFLLAFALSVSAQDNPYPNELEGLEFFGKNKLKDLKPIVSSKDDVIKIFGSDCNKICQYNEDWSLRFEYFEHIWIKTSRNEKDELLKYFLDSKYLGKLSLIEIYPKKQVSFKNVELPALFQDLIIISRSTFYHPKKTIITSKYAFEDIYGLTYEIKIGADYNKTINSKIPLYDKGDLLLIRYEISEELKKDLFILQK